MQANDVQEYTSFATEINAVTDFGEIISELEVVDEGAGTKLLAIRTGAGQERTLTVATGDIIPCQAVAILTTTTVARLRAYVV